MIHTYYIDTKTDHFTLLACVHGKQLIKKNLIVLLLEGQLRHIVNSEPYVFEVKKGNRRYNQRHYDALGEVSRIFHYYRLPYAGLIGHTHLCILRMASDVCRV